MTKQEPEMNFTLRNDVIMHPSFKAALSRIEKTHERSKKIKFAEGLFITAPSGAGKTTLIEYYEKKHPRKEIRDRTIIPVLVIETPPAPTAKSLVETIQLALTGTIVKGTLEFQTKHIFTLLEEQKVELMIIDEIQHFIDRKYESETLKVSDWLKSFINKTNIPVVIFGLPRSLQILEMNEQLRRRFSAKYYMRPFDFNDEEQQKSYRAVLKSIGDALPIRCNPLLHEFNLARRFHYATNGLFDYIVKIIDAAIEYAESHDLRELDLGVFKEAFKAKAWNDAPEELNPFSAKFVFRRLEQPTEPFAPSDLQKPLKPGKRSKAA